MEKTLKKLAEKVAEYHGKLYLVGGATRDELMGRPNKDLDCELFGVTEAEAEHLLRAFAGRHNLKFCVAGKSFKVWKLRDSSGAEIDVSLPRRDRKISSGHRGFVVEADPYMSIEEAATRRDFTINALYKNVLTGAIIDPTFLGKLDIDHGIIRMVDPSAFAEDPLRVLRALQFSARFKFVVEYNTLQEMAKVNLKELPPERIFTEVEKALLQAEKPSYFFNLIGYLDNFSELFPIFRMLGETPQDVEWHPEGNVLIHTMMVVDEAARLVKQSNLTRPERLTVMLASLCHDFGKPSTTTFEDGRVRAKGHAKAGLQPTIEFLDALKVFTIDGFDVRGQVLALVEHHLSPPELFRDKAKNNGFNNVNVPRALRRLALKVRLDLLAMVSLADMLGRSVSDEEKENSRETIRWFNSFAKTTEVEKTKPERILLGRHLIPLGVEPGVRMGRILATAFELQLEGVITTLEDALFWFNGDGMKIA